MPRDAKPIDLHLVEGNQSNLTKEEIEKRKKAEEKLTPDSDNIKRPKWLKHDKIAQREWRKLEPELKELGLLTNIDTGALAHCVKAYSMSVRLQKKIEEEGATIEHTNTKGATNEIENPKVKAAQKYYKRYEKMLKQFGLTPSARASLAINTNVEEEGTGGEFDDL